MEGKKNIFNLKPADGAIGAHYEAVSKVSSDFKELSHTIIERCI